MRWNKPNLRNSLHDLLGRDKPSSTAWVRHPGMEDIRRAMLQSLAGITGCEVARMNMRLRYAADIEALWYLRSDLFSMLVPLRCMPRMTMTAMPQALPCPPTEETACPRT
jgi:hypothetical protein